MTDEQSTDQLEADLAASRVASEGYQTTIVQLQGQIDALEAELAALEAEGLQPLVDRLQTHIRVIKKLMGALVTAVEELTEQPSAK